MHRTASVRPIAPAPWAKALAACLAVVPVLLSGGALAQQKFPSRSIELIVPTPPGGGVDITGRMLAESAEATLGVKVVVVNQSGASGGVGVARMLAAKPDGYTLAYVWNAPITIAPQTLAVTYGLQSFVPVSQTTGSTPIIFCVKAAFPARNGREFVEVLQRNPDKYTYGNDGTGGMVQLAGERLFRALGVHLRAVPFKGSSESLTAFLGGHVDIYGGSVPGIGSHLTDGTAKCLLGTSRARNAAAPDAISAGELGFPEKATELWRGVIAPKEIPADRLRILEDGFRRAANTPRLREYVEKSGEKIAASTSAEFQSVIAAEYRDFGQLIQVLGLGAK